MIELIDIVSPELRRIHRSWCESRGPLLMAHLRDYNDFVGTTPAARSACVVVPAGDESPHFRHVGYALAGVMMGCRGGIIFTEIGSMVVRALVTAPFHTVIAERQPHCRRGSFRGPGSSQQFEQLLLPFADDQMRVCVVHAVYDLALGGDDRIAA